MVVLHDDVLDDAVVKYEAIPVKVLRFEFDVHFVVVSVRSVTFVVRR
jgi:hypothetical protein